MHCTHLAYLHPCTHVTNAELGQLQIVAVQKMSLPSIVINCSTTGLPPTNVVWTRGNEMLVNNQTYQLSQLLSNRMQSAYNNLLTINLELQELKGIYLCIVINEQTGNNQSRSDSNITLGKRWFQYLIFTIREFIRKPFLLSLLVFQLVVIICTTAITKLPKVDVYVRRRFGKLLLTITIALLLQWDTTLECTLWVIWSPSHAQLPMLQEWSGCMMVVSYKVAQGQN